MATKTITNEDLMEQLLYFRYWMEVAFKNVDKHFDKLEIQMDRMIFKLGKYKLETKL